MDCGENEVKDEAGKTPEQRHREHIEAMDVLRRREEVRKKISSFLKLSLFFYYIKYHANSCSVMDNASGFGLGDCRFESCHECLSLLSLLLMK